MEKYVLMTQTFFTFSVVNKKYLNFSTLCAIIIYSAARSVLKVCWTSTGVELYHRFTYILLTVE